MRSEVARIRTEHDEIAARIAMIINTDFEPLEVINREQAAIAAQTPGASNGKRRELMARTLQALAAWQRIGAHLNGNTGHLAALTTRLRELDAELATIVQSPPDADDAPREITPRH